MSNEKLRQSLKNLGDIIEQVANAPAPAPVINDRSISGNKLNGGIYTNFRSVGIKDNASYPEQPVLIIDNDKIVVPAIDTSVVIKPLTVKGNLTVEGEVHAHKLHVDEISADVRNERTSNLEFKGENGNPTGKGLIWTGGDYTKQLTLQGERLFSSESFDVAKDKDYKINNQTVISSTELGIGITKSYLRKVGTLNNLSVEGNLNIDNYVFYDGDSQRLGIGTAEPNGYLSVRNLEHEFIIDSDDDRTFKLGTWSTTDFALITDDKTRIKISASGTVEIFNKVAIDGKLGVGVKNFASDADITSAGPIRIQGKKMEYSTEIPVDGSYVKGDIVWNSNPRPSGYVGWICVREGTPGEWKTFGQISS